MIYIYVPAPTEVIYISMACIIFVVELFISGLFIRVVYQSCLSGLFIKEESMH